MSVKIVRKVKPNPSPKFTKKHKPKDISGWLSNIHPGCVPEYKFHPTRKWRFDYAWPDMKIALELEGFGGGHQFNKGFRKDLDKYGEAWALGWRVLRVSYAMMNNGTGELLLRRGFQFITAEILTE